MTARDHLEQLLGPALATAIVDAVREELEQDVDRGRRAKATGYCSVSEAAAELGVSSRSVYRQVKAGQLQHRRVGERIVIARSQL